LGALRFCVIPLIGHPIVKDRHVTCFTNTEEEAVQLTNVVPFLVEDELKRLGGIFEKADDWQSFGHGSESGFLDSWSKEFAGTPSLSVSAQVNGSNGR
jgi:putative intracellular protease/amidase